MRGILDKERMDWFDYMEISYEGNNTILSGIIRDESHLHGVLNKIRDLNLKLVSVNPDQKENVKNANNNKQ